MQKAQKREEKKQKNIQKTLLLLTNKVFGFNFVKVKVKVNVDLYSASL